LNHLRFSCVYVNVASEGFRCSFRVGIEVLLAAQLEQRPQVGCVALLSAEVTAYKNLVTAGAGRKSGLSRLWNSSLIEAGKMFSLTHA
jgi:hypothetical protein